MTRHALYSVIVLAFVQIVLALLCIGYANYVGQQSNSQWCGIVSTLDDTYQTTPPATATGIDVAREIHRLRMEFKC